MNVDGPIKPAREAGSRETKTTPQESKSQELRRRWEELALLVRDIRQKYFELKAFEERCNEVNPAFEEDKVELKVAELALEKRETEMPNLVEAFRVKLIVSEVRQALEVEINDVDHDNHQQQHEERMARGCCLLQKCEELAAKAKSASKLLDEINELMEE